MASILTDLSYVRMVLHMIGLTVNRYTLRKDDPYNDLFKSYPNTCVIIHCQYRCSSKMTAAERQIYAMVCSSNLDCIFIIDDE